MTRLPEGWAECCLSDVAEINPALDRCPYPANGMVHFVPMPAVGAETGSINFDQHRPYGEVRKGYTAFVGGDVLFAKITPCMENGKMAVVPDLPLSVAFGSTEFHVLRCRTGIVPEYLYYFVSGRAFRYEAEHKMTGAVGQKRVPTSFVAEHGFPLPPLPEQHRIVAKLEELFSELDAGTASLTRARAQLKTYRQALLKTGFEGKLTAPWRAAGKAWRQTRLGNEITFLTSGSRGWADHYADQGEIFIRAQNLKHDRLDLTDIAFVQLPAGATEGLRTRVQIGDVLVTITGANVTKTGMVNRDLGTAYVSQHVALCRSGPNLRPEFLYWYLLSETGGRRQLNAAAYGAGKPGLNLENIREVTLRLPCLEEQDEIIAHVSALLSDEENISQTIQNELTRITALRQSILKKAFSGQLVTQDPADEPASALLARLAATAPKPRRKTKP
jgi:type I restriction enzyme, S subunit